MELIFRLQETKKAPDSSALVTHITTKPFLGDRMRYCSAEIIATPPANVTVQCTAEITATNSAIGL